MTEMINVALFGWFGVIFVLFMTLSVRRAIIASVILGVMFLPEIHLSAIGSGAPPPLHIGFMILTKENAISVVTFLAVCLFDLKTVLAFRPKWYDVPALAFCFAPFLSNYFNGETLHDCLTGSRDETFLWVVPYFLGRVYFSEPAAFRELAIGLVLGGVLYAPFCLSETKFFPFWHERLYGFFPGDKGQVLRGDGYRPVVFMQHGLAVGLWMMVATLMAVWLWWTGALKELEWRRGAAPIPMLWVVVLLLCTSALVRSTGAIVLALIGGLALCQPRWMRTRLLLAGMLLVCPLYLVGRTLAGREPTGWLTANLEDGPHNQAELMAARGLKKPLFSWATFSGEEAKDFLGYFSQERAASMVYRWINEDQILEKAWLQPTFGWGGTGKAILRNRKGEAVTVRDGLWIIVFGDFGFFGLICVYTMMLLPCYRFFFLHKASLWSEPLYAPAAAATIVLTMYMIDCLSNGMVNPTFMVMAGGLAGVAGVLRPQAPLRETAPAAEIAAEAVNGAAEEEKKPPAQRPGVLSRRPPTAR